MWSTTELQSVCYVINLNVFLSNFLCYTLDFIMQESMAIYTVHRSGAPRIGCNILSQRTTTVRDALPWIIELISKHGYTSYVRVIYLTTVVLQLTNKLTANSMLSLKYLKSRTDLLPRRVKHFTENRSEIILIIVCTVNKVKLTHFVILGM